MVTMMAGVLLLVLGFTGLGTAVKFIPRPVVLGFTNGIALLIASTQIKDFLGLDIGRQPSEFFERVEAIAHSLPTFTLAGRRARRGRACDHRRRCRAGCRRYRAPSSRCWPARQPWRCLTFQ